MSMISSLIDELRELASRYDELQVGAVKAVTMPSGIGSILREAADTIWQLRDDLQRANAAVQDAEHDESVAWDRVRKAEAENASLRGAAQGLGELCDKYKAENARLREELEQWHRLTAGIELPEYPITEFKPKDLERENAELRELIKDLQVAPCCGEYCWMKLSDRMRELGIEVD